MRIEGAAFEIPLNALRAAISAGHLLQPSTVSRAVWLRNYLHEGVQSANSGDGQLLDMPLTSVQFALQTLQHCHFL